MIRQDGFVDINEIPTHISTWGKWIEEPIDEQEIVICIPGIVGLNGYYTTFLSAIHKELDPAIPIWAIGYAGHNEPEKTSIRELPALSGNESKYNLEAQVKHKIAFIEKYVPKNVKIHLIGHSIGAWIILQLLKESSIKDRIQKCYLLFPTVERSSESLNGQLYTIVFQRIYAIISYLNKLLHMLPVFIRLIAIFISFWLFSIPRDFTDSTILLIRPSIFDHIVFLTNEKMKRVKDLDIDIIKDNVNLLKFYYGTIDGWVPVRYYEDLKQRVPEVDATLDDKKMPHCFMLQESIAMAERLVNWINQNKVSK